MRDIPETAAFVSQKLDRHPFADCDQVKPAIPVEIDPGGVGDHPTRLNQFWRDLLGHIGEMAAIVAEDIAARGIRIFARGEAPTDEKIGLAVAVEVTDADDALAGQHRWQRLRIPHKTTVAPVDVESILQQRRAWR